MDQPGAAALLYLLDQAWRGDDEAHALYYNLRALDTADWRWRPPGGRRTARAIAEHAGVAKHLYADHLFGAATSDYASVMMASPCRRDRDDSEALLAWLADGHASLRAGIAAIDDPSLDEIVRTHWGEMRPRRNIIATIITHDFYHAGEINHIRALRQGNDRWDIGLDREDGDA